MAFLSLIPTFEQLLEEYGADHIKASQYYLQRNDQAEATNKTLPLVLSKMVYKEPKRWADFLLFVLWVYHKLKHTSTYPMPFLWFMVKGNGSHQMTLPSARLM